MNSLAHRSMSSFASLAIIESAGRAFFMILVTGVLG